MCGIFGYLSKTSLNDNKIIKSLDGRGPDNNSICVFKNPQNGFNRDLKLFHTRLSIIDLESRSNQPFFSDNNQYVITYNGEIYNYIEIRNILIKAGYKFKTTSDTEVILNAYIHWGKHFLLRLRGMFAFCIYDKNDKSLFLARDPFGMKPLYYLHDDNTFIFSSLVDTIINSGLQKKFTLSETGINDYLALGSFLNPDTIFNEVKMLSPGYCMRYKLNRIEIEKYIDFTDFLVTNKYKDKQEIEQKIRNTLINSVEKHLIADVPVGVLLSGGIDSSIIAGIASKILNRRINTYSIGYNNKAYKKIDESGIAEKTSGFINSNHENILIDFEDFNKTFSEFLECIDVPSIDGFNTYLISKNISQRGVKVALSGLGGDEMFAGYPIFKEIFKLQSNTLFDKYISFLPNKVLNRIGKSYLKYYNTNLSDVLLKKRLIGELKNTTSNKLKMLLCDKQGIFNMVSLYEIKGYMTNTLLRDSDAVSLSTGLEIRVPFVDLDVLKLILQIPDNMKINAKYNKHLLVDSFKDILIPDVYKLPKRGFSLPIIQWTNQLIKDYDFSTIISLLEKRFGNNHYLDNLFFNNDSKDYNKFKWFILLQWLNKNKSRIDFSKKNSQ